MTYLAGALLDAWAMISAAIPAVTVGLLCFICGRLTLIARLLARIASQGGQ